jgi:hypothetical protein
MNNLDVQNDDTLYEDSYNRYIEYARRFGDAIKLELLGLAIETNYDSIYGQRHRVLTRKEFREKIRTSPLFREDWGTVFDIPFQC